MVMKAKIFCLTMIWLLMQSVASGQYIEMRLSIKVILHPTTGARPAGISNGLFYTSAENANQWMANYWRGYRFRVTEIVDIGGPGEGGTNGPSKWHYYWNTLDIDIRDQPYWGQFQSDTKASSLYRLRNNQVNFYVMSPAVVGGGGACPIPPGEVSDVACMGIVGTGPWWLVHESGHFFGLGHTHGGCGCPGTANCFLLNGYWVGDDGIADTLPEAAGDNCFTSLNEIAQANFGKTYFNCTPAERFLVDSTFYNVMSYHNPDTKDQVEDVMTELQLDRHADTCNTYRAGFVSGRTWFVRPGAVAGGSGSSTDEFHLLAQAVNSATVAGGDVVTLRPGSFSVAEPYTINKPLTLRATRNGWVTIRQ
jgi:hypothetical protein